MPTRPPDDGDDFFDQMRPSSVKKADILVRFFKGWAGVLHKHVVFLLYIDLFAGPGSYKRDQNGALRRRTIRSTQRRCGSLKPLRQIQTFPKHWSLSSMTRTPNISGG